MALAIKRTGADDYGRYTKALICGEPGSGKTLISSTWKNPIFASAEGGLMSVADRNVPFVEIKSSKDLLELKSQLDQPAVIRTQKFGFEVDSVIIDTIDEVQKILIAERLRDTKSDAMKMQDWGWLGEQMKAIITGFRNMDLNVVFCCHIKDKDDQETGQSWTQPGLQGSIGGEIAAYVDFSLLLKTATVTEIIDNKAHKRIIRVLQTYRDARNPWIKDRSGKLPSEFEVNFDDDFERIHDIVFANVSALPESTTVTLETVERQILDPEPTPTPQKAAPAPAEPARPKVPKPTPKVVEKPVEAPEATTEPTPDPEPVTEAPTQEPSKSPAGAIVPKNKLPDGVTPVDKGTGCPYFCEECGGQLESQDRADLSRIRFRRFLDEPCFNTAKR